MSKLTSYTLNGCTSLCINYFPIKLIKTNFVQWMPSPHNPLVNHLCLIRQGLEIFHHFHHHLLNTLQVAQVPPRVCPELEPALQTGFEQIRVQWASVTPPFYCCTFLPGFAVSRLCLMYTVSVSLNVLLLSVQLKFLWTFLEICSHWWLALGMSPGSFPNYLTTSPLF